MIQQMILPGFLSTFKHSWRVLPSNILLSRVLEELRFYLESLLPKELASKVYLVADELLRNSLEHGCFKIGTDRKAELLKKGEYETFLTELQGGQSALTDSWIELDLEFSPNGILLQVRDSGAGYDFDSVSNEKSLDLARLSQRGIQIVQSLSSKILVSKNPTQTSAYFS